MAYALTDVRDAVRALLLNQSAPILTDDQLDSMILQAKRRMDRDSSDVQSFELTDTSANWHTLTAVVPNWINGFSTVKSVMNPTIVDADEGAPVFEDRTQLKTQDFLGIDKLYMPSRIATGKTALLYYTAPWKVANLGNANATTVDDRHKNALEYQTAAIVCFANAAKSAGVTDQNIPADFMNFRTKEAEYRRVGNQFKALYNNELGIVEGAAPPAAMVRAAYPQRTDRLTHGVGAWPTRNIR